MIFFTFRVDGLKKTSYVCRLLHIDVRNLIEI